MTIHDVHIVRPKKTFTDTAVFHVASWLVLFYVSWIIMLVLPATVFNIAPGYWTTFATLVVIRFAWGGKSGFMLWTKEHP